MKNFILLLTILFSMLLISSCERETQEKNDHKEKGIVSLTFSKISIEGQLIASELKVSAPKTILISIINSDGEYVLNAHKLNLTRLGNGYFTEHIELVIGDYAIEDFLVLDSNDSVIYITPKVGSDFEDLVPHPLPLSFSISADETSKIVLDVIPANLGSADRYGYATFSFNIINVLAIRPDSVNGKDAVFGRIVPDNNYGDIQDIHLYAWTHNGVLTMNRVAIDFDLSTIPPNAIIDSALLNLYFNSTSPYLNVIGLEGHSGENSFVIEKIIEEWEENTITWRNQPATTTDHQVFVEDFDDGPRDYENIDITKLVYDLYQYPDSTFGLMIKHQVEEPYKVTFFASSDHPDKSKRPMLSIYYH